MTWTIISGRKYEKLRSKAGLLSSEEQKLDEWLALVPTKGPFAAAKELHIDCTKLKGVSDEWHLYLGSYQRLFFTVTEFEQVELLGVGHT
ncbi:hypothetical protein [Sorangium sp. So ce1335]|uniref:hypothetical protein n=1 Tax=Sorangium sp. So ce1335 TaxID=3133335 RepID=UPI003F6416C2